MFSDAGQQEGFRTAGETAPDGNGRLGKAQQFCNKINSRFIRFAVNRRCGQTQLERIAVQSCQPAAGGSGLDMQQKQQTAVRPSLQAGQSRSSGLQRFHASIEAYFHG